MEYGFSLVDKDRGRVFSDRCRRKISDAMNKKTNKQAFTYALAIFLAGAAAVNSPFPITPFQAKLKPRFGTTDRTCNTVHFWPLGEAKQELREDRSYT